MTTAAHDFVIRTPTTNETSSTSKAKVVRHEKGVSFDSFYYLDNKLGSGGFSLVYEAINRQTKQKEAVKIISRVHHDFRLEYINVEINILSRVNHPNIVQLKEVFEEDTRFFLVMELLKGGELFDHLVARHFYSEGDAACVIGNILAAVAELHDNNIVHRDIKLENLLLKENSEIDVKLTDFGLAYELNSPDEKIYKVVGTPAYMAPEALLTHKKLVDGFGKPIDIWACGVVLYVLLSGRLPFYGENNHQTFRLIMAHTEAVFPSKYWKSISSEGKDLVSKLLTLDPAKRPTAKQALEHPWLSKCPHHPLHDTHLQLKKLHSKGFWKRKFSNLACIRRLTNDQQMEID